jgi:protocatechuate 3,4-dioxygenase beta subunit
LRDGESVVGRVVDAGDRPVPGAKVLVAQTSNAAPVDFAQKPITADADGRFEVGGFGAGRITAAARRDASEPWTVVGPLPVAQDCVIRLAARHTLTVRCNSPLGGKVEAPRVVVIAGHDNDFLGMAQFGVVGTIGKVEPPAADGAVVVRGLTAGTYWLQVDAPGHAEHSERLELQGDREVTLELKPATIFRLRVTNHLGRPIRNAAVYAEQPARKGMPVHCGLTAADGTIAIDDLPGPNAEFSVLHPKYGGVTREVAQAAEVVEIVLAEPGALRGVLTENGKPPLPGKWFVAIAPSGRDSGATMPRLVVPDLEGKFAAAGLEPRSYHVQPVQSLRAIQSPGTLMKLAMEAWMQEEASSQDVTITAGQTADVALDTGREQVLEGETGTLSGTLLIDGAPGAGIVVTANGGVRRVARVDAAGRFDLGRLAAGHVWVQVHEPSEEGIGERQNLWSRNLELKANEDRVLEIALTTARLAGVVLDASGVPVEGCNVTFRAHVGGKEDGYWVRREALTDAQGRFQAKRLPAGKYTLEARKPDVGRGTQTGIELAEGGLTGGIELRLAATVSAKGRLELGFLGGKVPEYVGVSFQRPDGGGSANARADAHGAFEVDDLVPGSYSITVWTWSQEDQGKQYRATSKVEVGPRGADGLVVTLEPLK